MKPSLALLEQVARGLVDRRIIVVGTYRDVEVDRVHPLAQTLAALRRMEHHERISIRGFTEESVYELLSAIEPSEEAEAAKRSLAQVLHQESEGNPFFIREVINNLVETGKLVQQDGIWTGTVASIEELGIPEGVKEVIGRRLSRLSEACNRMLQRASAMTSGFRWEELRAICDESEETLLDCLDEALGAQLIAERGGDRYAFTHALIRVTLYEEMSAPQRAQLHRRTAEALETLYVDNLDPHLGELASHYVASVGGGAEKAIDYSVRAASRAMELVAWEEAALHYQRALDAMAGQRVDERKCSILLALGHAHLNAGQNDAAMDAFLQAAAAARAMGAAQLLAEAACGFDEAGYYSAGGATIPPHRLALADQALSALGAEDSALRARLLSRRAGAAQAVAGSADAIRASGWGSMTGERDPEILSQLREAVAIAERVGDANVTANTLLQLFYYQYGPGNQDERRQIAEKVIKFARIAGNGRDEYEGWDSLYAVALQQGDMVTARDAYEHSQQRGVELRIGRAPYQIVEERSTLSQAEGRLDDAEREMFEALKAGQSINDSNAVIAFGGKLIFLRWYQGRIAELEAMLRGLVEDSPNVAAYQCGLVLVSAEKGELREAAQRFDALAATGLGSIPEDGLWSVALVGLTLACVRLGARENVRELYDVLGRYPDGAATAGGAITLGAVTGFLGILAALQDRWSEATSHFEAALELNERIGHRPALACARKDYAEMLLRRRGAGDGERAHALLQQSLEAARDMGMARLILDCERLLAG